MDYYDHSLGLPRMDIQQQTLTTEDNPTYFPCHKRSASSTVARHIFMAIYSSALIMWFLCAISLRLVAPFVVAIARTHYPPFPLFLYLWVIISFYFDVFSSGS